MLNALSARAVLALEDRLEGFGEHWERFCELAGEWLTSRPFTWITFGLVALAVVLLLLWSHARRKESR